MLARKLRVFFCLQLISCGIQQVVAQDVLSLTEAVEIAIGNYGSIKAKTNYAEASKAGVVQARYDYLPNFNIAAQKDYGTVNGQNGPLYGFGGLGVASSGLPLASQNWNSAFGSLYLTNINWDFFAFGRAKEKVKTAESVAVRDEYDRQQEIFQHRIKVAAAYLNLVAAQRLTQSYQKNLERAETFRNVVVTRTRNGLIAGVDSSQANAEVSNAKMTLTRSIDIEQEQATNLAQLMGVSSTDFRLDTLFITQLPAALTDQRSVALEQHPLLRYYQSRVELSERQMNYYRTFYYPAFSLVGVFQGRGSGFKNNYASDQTAYTHNILDGFSPTRFNYLIGIGVTWNITQPLRISQQVKAQHRISLGMQNEYDLANQQLNAQLTLSDIKIKNALANYREVPVQVGAAADAYKQKSVLYKNGLTNLVDVTQALYLLVRAETDRDIAYNNVWQALLLKAAASGDFELFLK